MGSVDFKFKTIIVGPGAVGKTSIINRFVHNRFSTKYQFTIGVDFLSKRVSYDFVFYIEIFIKGQVEHCSFLIFHERVHLQK